MVSSVKLRLQFVKSSHALCRNVKLMTIHKVKHSRKGLGRRFVQFNSTRLSFCLCEMSAAFAKESTKVLTLARPNSKGVLLNMVTISLGLSFLVLIDNVGFPVAVTFFRV